MAMIIEAIIFVLGISMYIAMPVVIVWGWMLWKSTRPANTDHIPQMSRHAGDLADAGRPAI
jgi:hypothetical protein